MPILPEHLVRVSEYRSILCLDGSLPDASFFKMDLPVIAADGAANALMAMGVRPEVVIGDLDSLLPEYREQLKTYYHFDQNYCDFEKSLSYLDEQGLLPCMIVGINGGFLDHILNNINIFMASSHFFYAPPLFGYVIRHGEERKFHLPLNTKISIMGIPSALVSSVGLQWELNQSLLTFPGPSSCFNRCVSHHVQLRVLEGSALILIYHHSETPL